MKRPWQLVKRAKLLYIEDADGEDGDHEGHQQERRQQDQHRGLPEQVLLSLGRRSLQPRQAGLDDLFERLAAIAPVGVHLQIGEIIPERRGLRLARSHRGPFLRGELPRGLGPAGPCGLRRHRSFRGCRCIDSLPALRLRKA